MLVALGELGIPLDDARFVKNGFTILDDVLSYRKADGSFGHTGEDSPTNQMSTEQGLYGRVSALRAAKGSNSLYRMGDARKIASGAAQDTPTGLPGKHADVHAVPVTAPGTTFPDIRGHLSQTAIEALAATGIINGKSPERIAPDASMTRAELATNVPRGLGVTPAHSGVFTDVTADAWYAGFIGTANSYGIVNGVGNGLFAPQGTMSMQEAVTMVARAAKLCGIDTTLSPSVTSVSIDRLFGREIPIASWAMDSYAFCLRSDILELTKENLEPTRIIRRSEISQMLYNLLDAAELLAK